MSNWVSGLRRVVRTATISCIALAMFSAAAHAQSFNIANVTRNTASKASFPSVVTDGSGNINVVWIDNVKGLQFSRSSSTATATTFGTSPAITTITGPPDTAVSPRFQLL